MTDRTGIHQTDSFSLDAEQAKLDQPSRSPTPDAPAWSPITPTTIALDLPAVPFIPPLEPSSREKSQSRHHHRNVTGAQEASRPSRNMTVSFAEEPELRSISQDDNTDAIALRSALDILQMQRARAINDIRALQRQKETALADVSGFVQALMDGQINGRVDQHGVISVPRRSGHDDAAVVTTNVQSLSEASDANANDRTEPFEVVPVPQNVVRCPPVNWDKYKLDGEPFEQQHHAQRKRLAGPLNSPSFDSEVHSDDHIVAGPYRPFRDNLKA